jgi:hypothetical protein
VEGSLTQGAPFDKLRATLGSDVEPLRGTNARRSRAAQGLAFLDQAGPTQKALGNTGSFIEPELVQVPDLKRQAKFVANLFFGNHRRPRIVGLTRVAGQNQAAATSSQLPRHRRGVLFRCISTNGMVTTAIEKEFKGSIQVRQTEHIGDQEMHLNAGGVSAFFRSLDCQWSQVDTGYVKALLGQPDTIGSRATAKFERATRPNCVST